jgi:formate/nitrite transporter FocA (FNT family)
LRKSTLLSKRKQTLIETSYLRYAARSAFACLFLTLGSAIAFVIAMKGEEIAHGFGKMLYAFMFSWSFVMILYMNAELGTSNMLYMTVGVYRKRLHFSLAAKILFTCILFNLDRWDHFWDLGLDDRPISRISSRQLYV